MNLTQIKSAALTLLLLAAPAAALAASDLPLVIIAGRVQQLPAGDSLKLHITGSTQCLQVDTAGVVAGSGAGCGGGGGGSGTVTSITAGVGLTGGTITTSGTIALDVPSASTLGGIESLALVSHKWIDSISTSGVPNASRPACADLSDSTAFCSLTTTNGVLLSYLAQSAANTMLGNWTGSTANVAANAMPSCPDTGGNHLNYVGGTGVTCGTSGGGSGTVTTTGSPSSGFLAKFSGSTSITSGDISGDCTTSGTLAIVCTKTSGSAFAASATTDTTSASNIGSGSLALARITASGSANVVLGALTATTPSYLAVPSCSGGSSALIWTSGSGFGCNTFSIGTGTVTSVDVSLPAMFSVSGGPITTSGTITATLANQTANRVFAGPSTGSPAAPTFRALVGADLPVPSASTLGGVESLAAVSHNFLTSISTSGVPTQAQPAVADLSDASNVPLLNANNVWTKAQRGNVATVTISTATFTPNFDNSGNFVMTLSHSACPCTIANPSTTPVAGQTGIIEVIQSATGSDTVGTWGSQYVAAGGTSTLTQSTTANAQDYYSYFVIDATHILISSGALNAVH